MIILLMKSPHIRLDVLIGISIRMSDQFKYFCRVAASSNILLNRTLDRSLPSLSLRSVALKRRLTGR
jgi:hypothetical protein